MQIHIDFYSSNHAIALKKKPGMTYQVVKYSINLSQRAILSIMIILYFHVRHL